MLRIMGRFELEVITVPIKTTEAEREQVRKLWIQDGIRNINEICRQTQHSARWVQHRLAELGVSGFGEERQHERTQT